MSHAIHGEGSIYFATLQGYVINETELYKNVIMKIKIKGIWTAFSVTHPNVTPAYQLKTK